MTSAKTTAQTVTAIIIFFDLEDGCFIFTSLQFYDIGIFGFYSFCAFEDVVRDDYVVSRFKIQSSFFAAVEGIVFYCNIFVYISSVKGIFGFDENVVHRTLAEIVVFNDDVLHVAAFVPTLRVIGYQNRMH